jgi:tetratricopeptide (TPR) repeat protein
MVQNFHLVWLDGNIDEVNDDDCRNSIMKLRQIVNTVNTFIDEDECIDFIDTTKEEQAFMICSAALGQTIVPLVHDIPQINSIYIFSGNKTQHEQWTKEWSKVKGVYTDITSICQALNQTTQDCDHNSVSISFVKMTDAAMDQDLDTLDQSFMYTQILKEILLSIHFEQLHFDQFITYCQEQLHGNTRELGNVEKLRKEYRDHPPIWWYTYNCFLYSMINKALRTMEVNLIIKMGFFVQDLHKHIEQLHSEQYGGQNHSNTFIVYRGQGLSQTDFEQLKKTQGGLLAFNNFLSTSQDRQVSLNFAQRTMKDPNLVGVLFVLTINPSISATPFAKVGNVGYYQKEEEILLSMHSVFRIGQVIQIGKNDRLCQVELTLTGDNDQKLHDLTKTMRKEVRGSTGWFRLGQLMIKLGQFDKAEELYQILINQTTDEDTRADIFHQLGSIKDLQGNYTEAITFCEKSLEIRQKTLPPNYPDLATCYNNFGGVYDNMGEYSKALSYYEQSLEIKQKTLPPNHPDLATSYNNIGFVYSNMGEYSKAFSYYEKSLESLQKTLPANHPDIASSYNNIGLVYFKMGEYSKSLSYYEKSLEIFEKTLPPNHPILATSYNNIGSMYDNMGEYSKALSYYEKDLEIRQKTLPSNHPDLATSYNNIGGVYFNMGEYSKALSYYEKVLEIRQKTFPPNHPSLAASYNNIGGVYYKMGEYSKALLYFEKSLEINQKTLPPNHPLLANSYNNIGSVYNNMSEYSKALSYYEKALEIRQKTLPPNHPDFAQSYNNIGLVYYKMGEYSKALSYYERALYIFQVKLPPNHPNIKIVKENIEIVKKKM